MKQSRFDEHQIVTILQEGNIKLIQEVCNKYDISPATYYKWKSRYNQLEACDLKYVKQLENENHRLTKMYIQASLEQKILQDAISGEL